MDSELKSFVPIFQQIYILSPCKTEVPNYEKIIKTATKLWSDVFQCTIIRMFVAKNLATQVIFLWKSEQS